MDTNTTPPDQIEVMVKVVDSLFQIAASEAIAIGLAISVDDGVQELWELFERGAIQLVTEPDDQSLGFRPVRRAVDRMRFRRKHRRLVEFRAAHASRRSYAAGEIPAEHMATLDSELANKSDGAS